MRTRTSTEGFSLIEIMIVVAIIGVVAAIAYPSYQGYLDDTYRSQAIADMKSCAMAMERFYSNGFTYVGAFAASCNANSPTEGTAQFTLSAPTENSTNFIIRATPVGGACGSGDCLNLNQVGDLTES